MTDVIKPTSGAKSESAIPQLKMVVPAENHLPAENTEDARQGGSVSTKSFESSETRPQELHGAVAYQKETATDGVPPFRAYTDLTKPSGTVRG